MRRIVVRNVGLRRTGRIPIGLVGLPFHAVLASERFLVPASLRERGLLYPLTAGLLWRAVAVTLEAAWLAGLLVFVMADVTVGWLGRVFAQMSMTVRGI